MLPSNQQSKSQSHKSQQQTKTPKSTTLLHTKQTQPKQKRQTIPKLNKTNKQAA